MGLKDTLTDLSQKAKYNKSICKFGGIYLSLDDETKEAFTAAMRSHASTMDITKALKSDGFAVRREFVGEKRKCFKDPTIQCCLGAERPEVPSEQ